LYFNRLVLNSLFLCAVVPGTASLIHAEEPASSPLTPIELVKIDDQAIAYATFQSHNQKVISNRHGIFITYVHSATENYLSQKWRLAHSSDSGRTFQTLFEETRGTSAPVLETDRWGELYLTRPDFNDGNAYLSRFATPTAQPITTTLTGGSAGKYCQLLDEPRQRVYYFAHNGTFHVTGTDGKVLKTINLLLPGAKAVTQYPHLSLGDDGTLYAAWTTNALDAYLYRSIQAMKTMDAGETWATLDGKPLTVPIVSDETGPTTRISRDDELEVHSWLSAFLFKNDKLHFVYWAKNSPERQRYLRYDASTGKPELDIEPIFARNPPKQPNDSGLLISDRANPDSPLYFVSTLDDRKRLACLVSHDNGTTWREFAISDRAFPHRVYSIGGARNLTADGEIIGTFTDVVESAKLYTEANSGTVYFFRIPTQPSRSTKTEYRIETIAGNGETGDTPDAAPDARAVPVDLPFGVEYGPDGGLFITAVGSHRVLRLDPANGKLTSVAGSGKKGYAGDRGLATQALLNEPYEVRFDSRGNMLILDMRNHVLWRVDRMTGIIRTIAGDGALGDRGDGGPAQEARLHYPHSMAVDRHDNIYIGDILNHRVRRIDARTGNIETVVGNGKEGVPLDGGLAREQPLSAPQGLAIYDGGLWLASYRLHRIWHVNLGTGVIRHIAGTGERGHSGDGDDPLQATLDGPRGMKISPDGILYLLEGENNILRAYDIKRNTIRTIAGVGPSRHKYEGDGGPATLAPLWQPHGVCVSTDGSLVISDTINHRVRKLIPIPRDP
jgi:DNA-binding beta-propeller fold protein YncE